MSTYQGTIGCTPNSVPMVFIVFSRDSGGFLPIHTHYIGIYRAYIGISHRGTLVGVHPTIPWLGTCRKQTHGVQPDQKTGFTHMMSNQKNAEGFFVFQDVLFCWEMVRSYTHQNYKWYVFERYVFESMKAWESINFPSTNSATWAIRKMCVQWKNIQKKNKCLEVCKQNIIQVVSLDWTASFFVAHFESHENYSTISRQYCSSIPYVKHLGAREVT